MAKELPYFKFQPSEWVTGDITLCSMETQGLFINLCCYYWIRDCNISLANAKQRFSNCFSLVEELLSKEIILLNDDEKIIIKFLDEQMEKFIDISEKRSKSGALKGKHLHNKSKAIAPYKEKEIDKEKEKNRERRAKKFSSEVFTFNGYPKETLDKFVNYWTEPNKSKTKMRFELEKTWDTARRLATWASREKVQPSDMTKEQKINSIKWEV